MRQGARDFRRGGWHILSLRCGGTVDVPALHTLRASVSEQKLSPAFRLEALLFDRRLPGTRSCAVCGQETDFLIQVSVVCERGTSKPDGSSRDEVAGESLGCLLGSFLGAGPWQESTHEAYRLSRQIGQDIAFIVPLPICDSCRPVLEVPASLRRALRQIPEYAALLDRYPDARIAVSG